MGRVDDRLNRVNVSQGLIGGVVVEPVKLRQLVERHVGMSDVIIGAQHDLVIDAVEVEQLTVDIGIDSGQGHAGAQPAGGIKAADVISIQVIRIVRQVKNAVRHEAKRPERERQT